MTTTKYKPKHKHGSFLSLTVLAAMCLSSRWAFADDKGVVVTNDVAESKVYGVLGGGASYGKLFSTGMTATTLEGGIAIQRSTHFGGTVDANVDLGKTATGSLSTHEVVFSGTLDGIVGPLRIGAGPQLSYFWLSRADSSTQDSAINAIGLGLRGRISVDLMTFDDKGRGLYLAITPTVEWLRGPAHLLSFSGAGAGAWNASGTAGIRF